MGLYRKSYRYYVVVGKTPPLEVLEEMTQWIVNNGIEDFHPAHNIDVPRKNPHPSVRFWFDNEEDAMAFKLRWM